jgi:DNA-binding transcriptional MerR regulator
MDDTVRGSARAGEQTTAPQRERLLNIGQVVTQLQPDFPGLSITKVRYLEDRGLLSPTRTKGRYRKYGAADVRRLRTILTLQRDEYLPLEVIRQRVDRAATATTGESALASTIALRPSLALRREESTYTWREVCQADAFLRALVEYHLVDRAAESGPVFTETDAEIARICQVLARFGVEPRNLRLLSSSAEREAAILEQVATPSLRSTHPDKREYGAKILEDLGAMFSQLLHLLLYRELRRLL